MTVLRHPVDRWYSHYFYNRASNSISFPGFRVPESIEEYAFSEAGVGLGNLYVRHLTAGTDPADPTAAAIETLDRMDLVGILEYPEDLQTRIQHQLGLKLDLPVLNSNPGRSEDQKREVTPELHARIESLCQPDMEVYRHALKTAGLPQP
ncbi:MAG: hypothetical protein KDA79_09140 [Planctomycetaceae bacterium]|nr:hypothetical protein [Planctomycetaceae bacterium]